ncbi:MAG TPA: guanylate kinase [Acidobacteriota bacterium]
MSASGILFVISGPSGSGKTTVLNGVLRRTERLVFSISYTTRKPRGAEVDGREYFFISEEQFKQKIEADAFVEYAKVHGHYYGTSRAFIESQFKARQDVLLDIDVQGARQVRERHSGAVTVFILPPSKKEIERRLRERGTDDEEALAVRIAQARIELEACRQYDYVIVNHEIGAAVDQLRSVIVGERCRRPRCEPAVEAVLASFAQ